MDKFPCNRQGAIAVGSILLQARVGKGLTLRALAAYGINHGTANHYEKGFLNKYMDRRVVLLLLEALQPVNPDTGKVYTIEEIQSIANPRKESSC